MGKPRYKAPAKIDLKEAQRLFDEGESVRTVAATFDVATESVYQHVREGRLVRPKGARRRGKR